jgi:hypothetical protein
MDRLTTDQRLNLDDQIASNMGWFTLRMFDNGALALYRTQVGLTMWTSPSLGRPGGFAIMQGDGNFVTYSPDGTAYWATGTDGHPGASLVIQDDGNLVIYDAADRAIWATNTVTNVNSPTIRYADPGSYMCDETSEKWKILCQQFPCFWALQWPGYATDVIDTTINGEAVVIQLWKGYCPKFLGFVGVTSFPGGYGAEVGVYRRIPGKARPASSSLSFLHGDFAARVLNAVSNFADNDLWWPFPELGATMEFAMINPITGETFLHAGPQTGYWLTKWMEDDSYRDYRRDHTTPAASTDYILDYWINGRHYRRWPGPPDVVPPTAAIELLLS